MGLDGMDLCRYNELTRMSTVELNSLKIYSTRLNSIHLDLCM